MEVSTISLVALLIVSAVVNIYLVIKKRQKENHELVLHRIIHDCISLRTAEYNLEQRSTETFRSLAAVTDAEANSFAITFIQNELAQLFVNQLVTNGIISAIKISEESKNTYNQVLARILMKPGIVFIQNPLGVSDEQYIGFIVELFFAKYHTYESDIQFLTTIKRYPFGSEVFAQKLLLVKETDIDEQVLLELFRSVKVLSETKNALAIKYYQHVIDAQETMRITNNTKKLFSLNILKDFIDKHAVAA